MRVPGPQVRLETCRDGGFLHALMNLKQVRVPGAKTNPDDLGRPLRRERAQLLHRKNEASEFYGAEMRAQFFLGRCGHVRKKTQSQMHLLGAHPAHPRQGGIQLNEETLDARGRIDGHEQALCGHSPTVSLQGSMASPESTMLAIEAGDFALGFAVRRALFQVRPLVARDLALADTDLRFEVSVFPIEAEHDERVPGDGGLAV